MITNIIFRRSDSPITSDKPHYPYELPEGWCWCNLNEIAESSLGKTLDKSKNTGKVYPYLCALNVKWNAFDLSVVKSIKLEDNEKERYQVLKGDLLICEGGDVGRSAIWNSNEPIYFQNALHRVRFFGNIVADFYLYLFWCYKNYNWIDDICNGVTIKHLTQDKINALHLPLPPVAEQQRIVIEVKKWFVLIDQIEQIENNLQSTIKQTKSKILDLAIHGKLVPQDPTDEPASELLKRINPKAEITCDNGHYQKLPFKIPKSWVWCGHNDILEISGGSQPAKNHFISVPKDNYIRLYQIRDYGDNPIPVYIPEELASKRTEKGDILLARYGGSLGKVFHAETGAYNVAMAKVIFKYPNVIVRDFAYYYYLSDLYQGRLKEISRTAQAGFNSSDFNEMFFPLPPYEEQKRIVKAINKTFTILDTIMENL